MKNTPTNTKLSLKKIVENLDKIPESGFNEEPKKLSPEQKHKLMEMACMFEKYGEVFKKETAIIESTKAMEELCNLAETYALNECGDCFQQDVVRKDMINMKKRLSEYGKVAKECYSKMQQLNVAHSDIGHILGRYYNLKELTEDFGMSSADVVPLQ